MNSTADELSSLRRVVQRGSLLLLPFLALQLIELFVLPIDFFTFRVWEAALSTPYLYPGNFYPNLHVRKLSEYGDHYREGDPSKVQAKPVEWLTDAYGWRNRPEIEKRSKYDVVVLGDSNIVGSFLDQKDMLTEVLAARGDVTSYSYSIGSAHISLFFSDPRLLQKSPDLLVVESKLGNWLKNDDYLNNFREMPDGSLSVVDRSTEFKNRFYAPGRNNFLEQLDSRLKKQPMFHWFRASLAADFAVHIRSNRELFLGSPLATPSAAEKTWRPLNWVASGAITKPLAEAKQPALEIRASGPNAFWHTERFIASESNGKISVRFEARDSVSKTRHRLWIFEDGSYRTVGEILGSRQWKTFDIPISSSPGSILEFQIDHPDTWQWLSIKNFEIVGASPMPIAFQTETAIDMKGWSLQGQPCAPEESAHDCRRWLTAGKKGYVQSPLLPQPGEAGVLIRFEGRTDKRASTFSAIHLFEGSQYRQVGQYAYDQDWREYSLLLQPARGKQIKVQFDFPDSATELRIRNFRAMPVERLN